MNSYTCQKNIYIYIYIRKGMIRVTLPKPFSNTVDNNHTNKDYKLRCAKCMKDSGVQFGKGD